MAVTRSQFALYYFVVFVSTTRKKDVVRWVTSVVTIVSSFIAYNNIIMAVRGKRLLFRPSFYFITKVALGGVCVCLCVCVNAIV